jgi:two-component system phosphate regulon sensor histidine kinase PhoR
MQKIIENFSDSSKLADIFYNKRHLPSEIERLLVAIIKYQTSTGDYQSDYLAERKMFNALLQNMKDGILITDEIGNVTMLNTSTRQIFKIGDKAFIGSSLAEVLRNHKVNELWRKCSFSQQQEMTTIEIVSSKAFIQCIATPLAPELPGNILFLFQDLTRMRQLEIIRRDFVSNVSHELRTPLASLKLIAETLESGALNDPPAAKHFLKQMDNEIDNLSQMVEELLELSRIESGQVPLDRQWINPCELIQLAGDRMAMQADRAGLEFSYGCDSTLPNIFVDASRLGQVLINLMHNAIKFTTPGGIIETSAYEVGNDIVFFVKDTGIGIPEKDLERIFERFFKSDPSRSKRGTGLGLSISRHLVETHGGKIWVESNRRNGSTFKFSIPVHL